MKLQASLFLFFLLIASVSFAASDTVMLVTDLTAVDGTVAAAAAAKAGIPVLVLEDGMLNAEIMASISTLAPTTIVLVGGPVVIKPEVETQLTAAGYSVIRLWGMERTGTALEVAKHFWPEGASCAVLVEDTKSANVDTRREIMAASLASHYNCTLIPIPDGTAPAEVVATLKDLRVSNVWFLGRTVRSELRDSLQQFRLKVLTGSDDALENQTENETGRRRAKLVIVATPDWKAAGAFASMPTDRSIVRHVSSVNNLSVIISLIQTNNITDVRVVGTPPLSGEIAGALLAQANITVTHISGPKPFRIAIAGIQHAKQEWEMRRTEHEREKQRHMTNIKAHLLRMLEDLKRHLDAVENEALSAPTGDAQTRLLAAIAIAKNMTNGTMILITAGQYDEARIQLARIKESFAGLRYALRNALRIDVDDDAQDEEEDVNEGLTRLDMFLNRADALLPQIRNTCANSDVVDALIAKAKTLRIALQTARTQGDHTVASNLTIASRELAQMAEHIGEACKSQGSTGMPLLERLVERRGIKVVRSGSMNTNDSTIQILSTGFRPNTLTVRQGTTVTFVNRDTVPHWPASAMHPTHTVYPGSDILKCGTAEQARIFDACAGLATGQNFTFTFNEKGMWRYHDHMNTQLFGAVTVE